MANVLGTVAVDVIGQEALTQLLAKFPMLKKFSNLYSTNQLLFGQKYRTRLIGDSTGAQVKTINTSTSTDNYVAANFTNTDATVTLNQEIYQEFQIYDQEANASSINLALNWSPRLGFDVGLKLFQSITNQITTNTASGIMYHGSSGEFNYPAGTPAMVNALNIYTKASGSFVTSDLAAIANNLDSLNVADDARFGVLAAAAYNNLFSDSVILANAGAPQARDASVLATRNLGQVLNFDLMRTTALSSTVTAEPNYLSGFFSVPEAIGVVMSAPTPALDDANKIVEFGYVTDPDSGMTLQTRKWYDPVAGATKVVFTTYFGSNLLDPRKIVALTSSAPTSS